MASFEDVSDEIGSNGPFQLRAVILANLFLIPVCWSIMLPIFSAAVPDFRCPASGPNMTEQDGSHGLFGNMTLYWNESKGACTADNEVCPGIEYTSHFTSVISEWDLLCNKAHVSSLITSIQMSGQLFGAVVSGQLGDRYGRKRMHFISYSLLLLAGFLSAFATSWQLHGACRFFVGIFFAGEVVFIPILAMEYVSSKWRSFAGAFWSFSLGLVLLPGIAYIFRDWRHLTMVTTAGGSVLLICWWWVPESPRWLIKQGRLREAETILVRIAKFNGQPTPDMSDLRAIYEKDKEAGLTETTKYNYFDLFRNCTMTKYTMISMYTWFTVAVTFYAITFNLSSLSGNVYLNVFLSATLDMIPMVCVVAFSNRSGRKLMSMILLTIAGVSCLGIIAVHLTGQLNLVTWLITALALLGKAGASGSWSSIGLFSAELFPTMTRSMGVGISSMSSRVASVLAPQLVYLMKFYNDVPYLVSGVLSIVAVFLFLLVPETVNKPLLDELPPRTICLCCVNQGKGQKTPSEKRDSLLDVTEV